MNKKSVLGLVVILAGFLLKGFSLIMLIPFYNVYQGGHIPIFARIIFMLIVPLAVSAIGAYLVTKSIKAQSVEVKNNGATMVYGGVALYYFIPFLTYLLRELSYGSILNTIFGIITSPVVLIFLSAIVIGLGVKTLLETPGSNESSNSSTTSATAGENKVVSITLWGGLLGLFAGSPRGQLEKAIEKENENGFRAVQVIEAASDNLFLWLLRLIILVVTLFIYTPANGYYITFEKNSGEHL